jgi:hypothetical protein
MYCDLAAILTGVFEIMAWRLGRAEIHPVSTGAMVVITLSKLRLRLRQRLSVSRAKPTLIA